MRNFLIFALIFTAAATFAQSDKQMEPVKQIVESEDIKMEMKETPTKELGEELDKLEEAVEEELELLEGETKEDEMNEEKGMEDVKEEEEMKIIDKEILEKVKEKLEIEPETDQKPDEK